MNGVILFNLRNYSRFYLMDYDERGKKINLKDELGVLLELGFDLND